MMNLIEQLKEHEGFRGSYYLCTAKKKTIGYGRNVDDNPLPDYLCRDFDKEPMTEDEAEELLIDDVNKVATQLAKKYPIKHLSTARQAVLINMAFNLGVNGLMEFKKMLQAIKDKDYYEAAIQMLDSKWARQVGSRSDDLAEQMLTGEW